MSKLKDVRNSRNMTQARLSEISGVSQQHISEIENGNRIGTIKTLIKLSEALNVTVDELVDKEAV